MINIIAHRAGKSLNGENTLNSAKSSIELNCDYIEIDIQQTIDNYLVVANRNEISETKLIDKSTYSDLENINLLCDFVKLVDNNVKTGLLLDLKSNINIIYLFDTIDCIIDKTVIMSKDFDLLKSIRKINDNVKLVYLTSTFDIQIINTVCKTTDIIAIGDKSSKPTKELIQYSNENDLEVWAFTINNITKMKKLIKIGIDGIITDYPQNLIRMINEKK